MTLPWGEVTREERAVSNRVFALLATFAFRSANELTTPQPSSPDAINTTVSPTTRTTPQRATLG
jgi:hypothetical protein